MPMAEPLRPSPSGMSDPTRELPEQATPSSLGHMPVETSSRLNSTAESVGSALGGAVSRVRRFPQNAKRQFTVIRGRKQREVRQAADEAIGRIREAGTELKEEARMKVDDARVRLEQTRIRVERYAHERPLYIIAGAAVFGFMMGIGMRIWRDHAC